MASYSNSAIPDGDYYLVNGLDATKVMDCYGGGSADYTNVWLVALNQTNAQVFSVRHVGGADGPFRVYSRWTGRAVSAQTSESGANVCLHAPDAGWHSLLDAEASGSTITFGGAARPTYRLWLHDAPTLLVEVWGQTAAAQANVMLYPATGEADQTWALVPVTYFRSAGCYEISPTADLGKCVAIGSSSRTNNAPAILCPRLEWWDQQWRLTDTGAGWRMAAVHSGQALSVRGGDVSNVADQQVTQWPWYAGATQRWSVEDQGETATIEGDECPVVRIGALTADTYCMSSDALGGDLYVRVRESTAANLPSLRWALRAVTPIDPSVPTPASVGLANAYGADAVLACREGLPLHATYRVPSSWDGTSGPQHAELRWRTRGWDPATTSWGTWSAWSAWSQAEGATDGSRVWSLHDLSADLPATDGRPREVAVQVRCVTTDGDGNVCGRAATGSVVVAPAPTLAVTGVTLSAESLAVAATSDIAGAWVTVSSVRGADGSELLSRAVSTTVAGAAAAVPVGYLTALPTEGESVTVTYTTGVEGAYDVGGPYESTARVAYAAGHADLSPVATAGSGRTALVRVAHVTGGMERCWVESADAPLPLTEVTESWTEGGWTWFRACQPLGQAFSVRVVSRGGSSWGAATLSWSAGESAALFGAPCDAWTWPGGSLLLEADTEAPSVSRSLANDSEALSLLGHSRQTVVRGPVTKGTITRTGVVVDGWSESTMADALALQEAGHATYRAPSGEVLRASCDVSYERHPGWCRVTVSMVEEG